MPLPESWDNITAVIRTRYYILNTDAGLRCASCNIADRPSWKKCSVWTRKLFLKLMVQWWVPVNDDVMEWFVLDVILCKHWDRPAKSNNSCKYKKNNSVYKNWKDRSVQGSWEHDLTSGMLVTDAVQTSQVLLLIEYYCRHANYLSRLILCRLSDRFSDAVSVFLLGRQLYIIVKLF